MMSNVLRFGNLVGVPMMSDTKEDKIAELVTQIEQEIANIEDQLSNLDDIIERDILNILAKYALNKTEAEIMAIRERHTNELKQTKKILLQDAKKKLEAMKLGLLQSKKPAA
jgi:oligoendopeptidase F